MGKLLGFDFTMEYKVGNTNTVADVLSRHDTEEAALLALSEPRFDFIERLRQANDQETTLVAIKEEITSNQHAAP